MVELSKYARDALEMWLKDNHKSRFDYVFTSLRGKADSKAIGRLQYSKLIKKWVKSVRLNPDSYSTHSIRRTLPALIYEEIYYGKTF